MLMCDGRRAGRNPGERRRRRSRLDSSNSSMSRRRLSLLCGDVGLEPKLKFSLVPNENRDSAGGAAPFGTDASQPGGLGFDSSCTATPHCPFGPARSQWPREISESKTNEGRSTLIGLDPESQNIPAVVTHLEADPDLIFLYVQSLSGSRLGVGCVV